MNWPRLLKFVCFQISTVILFQLEGTQYENYSNTRTQSSNCCSRYVIVPLAGSDAGQAQVALFNMLINPATSNYSVYDRPVAIESEPVNVSIKYVLLCSLRNSLEPIAVRWYYHWVTCP